MKIAPRQANGNYLEAQSVIVYLTRNLSQSSMPTTTKPRTAVPRKSASKPDLERVPPGKVIAELERHTLVDGFKLVFDPQKSHGSIFVDSVTGR